ncbi:uncharacterized protein BXZ73DRAFT_31057, partial [Epithele typhae]|uniref:uncharacterized protein n=1 Tax=Epithele typhae TaxID=378194 RepID=UPI002007F2BF
QLTSNQASRVAAQVVRLCAKEGDYIDALYLVNSACDSILKSTDSPKLRNSPSRRFRPVEFGQPVSPRLVSHAFLHGLLRGGFVKKATIYASLMVQAGIPIRSQTLETITHLTHTSYLPKFGPFARVLPRRQDLATDILKLRIEDVRIPQTRAAMELLQHARTFGHQRTQRMYRNIFATLLMQGELIVGSLLFVMVLKDWELHRAQEAVQEPPAEWVTYEQIGLSRPTRFTVPNAPYPYPDPRLMGKILERIETVFSSTAKSGISSELGTAMQSLALFAMLLDTGQLKTHRISGLISTMYACPKTTHHVCIWRDGQPVRIHAYTYFHAVVKRIIDSLEEDHMPSRVRLSRRSYNALLHYSLRHCHSSTMASSVLQHMCVKRDPPVAPDIVTFNILLRSGTLMRNSHISEVALKALRLGVHGTESPVAQPPQTVNPESELVDESIVVRDADGSALITPIRGSVDPRGSVANLAPSQMQSLDLPAGFATPSDPMKPSRHTLTSYIAHLVNTGKCDSVASSLFSILPELQIVNHPAHPGFNGQPPRKLHYRKALRNAAKHGPHVFAVLVNALCKAGEIGLAERVFILAQKAQMASRIPTFREQGHRSWTLPAAAYTSLLQGYIALARGCVPHPKRRHQHAGTDLLLEGWQPQARPEELGYSQYVHLVGESLASNAWRPSKRRTSRHNARLLVRSMLSGGRKHLEVQITKPDKIWPRLPPHPPRPWPALKPDARFFNVAWRLFTPSIRRHRCGGRVVASRGSDANGFGWNAADYSMMRLLVRSMATHGYDVPRAYPRLLVAYKRHGVRRGRERPV